MSRPETILFLYFFRKYFLRGVLLHLLLIAFPVISLSQSCNKLRDEFKRISTLSFESRTTSNHESLLRIATRLHGCELPTSEHGELLLQETRTLLFLARFDEAHRSIEEFFDASDIYTYEQQAHLYRLRGIYNQSKKNHPYNALIDYATGASLIKHSKNDEDRALFYLTVSYSTSEHLKEYEISKRFALEAETYARNLVDSTGNYIPLIRSLFYYADSHFLQYLSSSSLPPSYLERAFKKNLEALSLLSFIPENNPLRVSVLSLQSNLVLHAKKNFTQAHLLLDNGYALAKKYNDTRRLALILFQYGYLYFAQQQYPEAIVAFKKALTIDPENYSFHERLHYYLGASYEALNNYVVSLTYYEKSRSIVESHRSTFGTLNWSVSASRQEVYDGLIRCYIHLDRHFEAFTLSQHLKARNLRKLRSQASELSHLDSTLLDSLVSISEKLNALFAQLNQHSLDDTVYLDSYLALIISLAKQQEIFATIPLKDVAPDALSLPQLQATLKATESTLLAYFIDDEPRFFSSQRSLESYVFVVTPDSFHVTPLDANNAELSNLILPLSPTFTPHAFNYQPSLESLHVLYKKLILPIHEVLSLNSQLVIVPDRSLFHLPFSALVSSFDDPFSYEKAHFLVEDFPISYQLSAFSLLQSKEPTGSFDVDLLALGLSTFDNRAIHLPPLRYAKSEVLSFASLFSNKQVFFDKNATEDVFYQLSPQSRIIHIASHSFYNASSPFFSQLVLSPTAKHDGNLFFFELMQQYFSPELVVLSGCNTSKGKLYATEGMEGLHYAFHATGAHSSLSTLWTADDEQFSSLINSFYKYLMEGLSKSKALQQAQLDYMHTHKQHGFLVSPSFWALPVIYGSNEPVSFSSSRTDSRVTIAFSLLFLLLILLFVYIRFSTKRK